MDATPPRPRPQPASVPAVETPRAENLLGLAVGVVAVVALYLGREVLIPVTLAILLSFLLAPVVNQLRRIRLPKVAAVLLAVVLALAVILMLGGLIGSQIAALATGLPQYQATVMHKIASARSFTLGRVDGMMAHLGHLGAPAPHPGHAAVAAQRLVPGGTAPVLVQVEEPTPTPVQLAQRFLEPVVSPLSTLGVVFVVAIFILMQQEDLRDRLIRLFGSSDLHRTTRAIDDAGHRLSRYFLAQAGVNAGFGAIITVGLAIIGVPSPLLWGILGMLLRFVPYIGSMIAAVLPIALAAAVDPGWSMAIWTAALFVCVEGITGQAIEPMLYGHSTGLSPVAVIVVAIFWSWIWGPIGLILSTPLTLCLVVLGRHVERLEFFDVLFGDRPALTPVETFYQRLLANDPDEVFEQAETLLRGRSLSSYYDEVALRGLQLAANDVMRGVLSQGQVDKLRVDLEELVHELDGHDDDDPDGADRMVGLSDVAGVHRAERETRRLSAPGGQLDGAPLDDAWMRPGAVLCVSGRGPLDHAVSSMLAQLLGKHGIGATVVDHEAVSRTGIATLAVADVSMVCISYLEIAGNPSHLRYLIRRIRQRLPGRPVLVGLWPLEDSFLTDEEMRAAMNGDHYVSSLRDAVNACLDEASGRTPARALAAVG